MRHVLDLTRHLMPEIGVSGVRTCGLLPGDQCGGGVGNDTAAHSIQGATALTGQQTTRDVGIECRVSTAQIRHRRGPQAHLAYIELT